MTPIDSQYADFMSPDDIRHAFSVAMSNMYQKEVPLYTDLLDLVYNVNQQVLATDSQVRTQLEHTGEIERLSIERHGAIRLGTDKELALMRRLFAVMGMFPVGYYDLTPAGVPVHSTAFRAIDSHSLHQSPFRIFTSLLRLDLIDDHRLKQQAVEALDNRNIFTQRAIELIERFEDQHGLTHEQGKEFVEQALETFRWHDKSPISKTLYQQLLEQHRLIADIVGFKGPHINHLTPRTLDIDAIQAGMAERGIPPKEIIEGPPRRNCPILLRQTSFKALQEPVNFRQSDDHYELGYHTARFGEIEQRGVALTSKGRNLYDSLLNEARDKLGVAPNQDNAQVYYDLLAEAFSVFPDDYRQMHDQQLAYFYYQTTPQIEQGNIGEKLQSIQLDNPSNKDIQALLDKGVIRIEPIVYEDFLPVSAAGIFQSNLHDDKQTHYQSNSNKQAFEKALGSAVYDELRLYEQIQAESLSTCLNTLADHL